MMVYFLFTNFTINIMITTRVKNPNNINILLLEKELLDGEISTKNKISKFERIIKSP